MTEQRSERRQSSPFVRTWLPVLLYVGVIFTLSAQPNLTPPIEFRNSDKIYHLLEYAGFGWLLARALRSTLPGRPPLAMAGVAIVIGALLATSDEWFQSTVPGRQSSAFDGLADTLGVALAQGFYWRRRRRGSA